MTRDSTMQPFEPGDIFLGLTLLNNPDDDHAGDGRIVQYGKDLNKKGELIIESLALFLMIIIYFSRSLSLPPKIC